MKINRRDTAQLGLDSPQYTGILDPVLAAHRSIMVPIPAFIGAIVGLFLTLVTVNLCYLVVLSEQNPQHQPAALRDDPTGEDVAAPFRR